MVKREKENIPKPKALPRSSGRMPYMSTSSPVYKYRISDKGIKYVETGFVEEQKTNYKPMYINEQHIYNAPVNINYNYTQILNDISVEASAKQELQNNFEEIESELHKEQVNKNKIKELVSKIAEKGIDKLTDVAIGLILKQFTGL